MHKARQKSENQKKQISLLFYICILLLSCFYSYGVIQTSPFKPEDTDSDRSKAFESQSQTIKTTNLIDIIHSAVFKNPSTDKEKATNTKSSSFFWLHNPETQTKRSTIIGSKPSIFNIWWKMGLEGFALGDRTNSTAVIKTKIAAKVITNLTEFFTARAEMELLSLVGAIQQIYTRTGETSGINMREALLSYKATNWFNTKFGIINQEFLQAPLLLSSIPFPSILGEIDIFQGEENHIRTNIQGAVPNTFSDGHSIYTQNLANIPFLLTSSFLWSYEPKSFYNININSTFFHYSPMPSDVAQRSSFYGNSVVEQPNQFKYRYSGFYFSLMPSFQIASNLNVKLKAHYIINISKNILKDYHENDLELNRGFLLGIEVPIDITEHIRITPHIEWFVNQPDSSIGLYNSERYGHSDRTGYVGELTLHLYERNIILGASVLNSRPVRSEGSIREDQLYFSLFFRTYYAKL